MSRAVIYEAFGGPEILQLREVAEPHAGPGEVRVRVTAAGLNPMDWLIPSRPEAAAQFGLTLPSGFGYDFAGVVDEVGGGATGFAVGDRVYGGALGRAVADFVVLKVSAAGAEALADRVLAQVPGAVTAATDLFGTETAEAALALGVAPERISTVAAGPNPAGGVRATGGIDAEPDALSRITDAILAGQITVPIAAVFPIEQVRDAVELQAGRHVHGKIVITL
jgi:NADPH:quinone reductase-like Zn-dependent oxidoreductase